MGLIMPLFALSVQNSYINSFQALEIPQIGIGKTLQKLPPNKLEGNHISGKRFTQPFPLREPQRQEPQRRVPQRQRQMTYDYGVYA